MIGTSIKIMANIIISLQQMYFYWGLPQEIESRANRYCLYIW